MVDDVVEEVVDDLLDVDVCWSCGHFIIGHSICGHLIWGHCIWGHWIWGHLTWGQLHPDVGVWVWFCDEDVWFWTSSDDDGLLSLSSSSCGGFLGGFLSGVGGLGPQGAGFGHGGDGGQSLLGGASRASTAIALF